MTTKKKLEKDEIIPLVRNFMFIQVFYHHDGIKRLERFIADYLSLDYNEVKGNIKLLPRDQENDSKLNAETQIDLLLELDGSTYDIEVNYSNYDGLEERNLVFISKVLGTKYKKSTEYKNLKGSMLINLNGFNSNEQKLIEKYHIFEEDNFKLEYGKGNLRIDVVDMSKAKEGYKPKTIQEEKMMDWCQLFMTRNIYTFSKVCGKIFKGEEKERFIKLMEELSSDEEIIKLEGDAERLHNSFIDTYKRLGLEEGHKEGFEKGHKEGIEQGIEQNKKENAIEFHKNGASNELILNSLQPFLS